MRGERLDKEFAETLLGSPTNKDNSYELYSCKEGFYVLERDKVTGLVVTSSRLSDSEAYGNHEIEERRLADYKAKRMSEYTLVIFIVLMLSIISIGGLLCRLGILY